MEQLHLLPNNSQTSILQCFMYEMTWHGQWLLGLILHHPTGYSGLIHLSVCVHYFLVFLNLVRPDIVLCSYVCHNKHYDIIECAFDCTHFVCYNVCVIVITVKSTQCIVPETSSSQKLVIQNLPVGCSNFFAITIERI